MSTTHEIDEKQEVLADQRSSNGFGDPKTATVHHETAREAAERGHVATDK
jgi:hypothetical protein